MFAATALFLIPPPVEASAGQDTSDLRTFVSAAAVVKTTAIINAIAFPLGEILPSQSLAVSESNASTVRLLTQRVIDEISIDAISTHSGRRFCFALGTDTSRISKSLGVSSSAASEIAALCAGSNFDEAGIKGILANRSFAKNVTFLFTPKNDSPVESFTSPSNAVVLIFEPNEITRGEIAKRLVHEMAIAFDSKLSVDSIWLQKLSGLSPKTNNSCEIIQALNNPLLKFALATDRAMQLEAAVLTELASTKGYDLPPDLPGSFQPGQSCTERIYSLMVGLHKKRAFYAAQTLSRGEDLAFEALCFMNGPASTNDVRVLLDQQRVTLINGGSAPLCEWITTPDIRLSNTSYNRGPRPRITDW
jgi:hypothetical protein